MRRVLLALAAAATLTLATALPVASFGLTDVTVSCDDGTSFTGTVDQDTLDGLTNAIQSMVLFPANLSCALTQLPAFRALGGVASAWPGGGFIVGGGRFQAGCPGPLGGLYWVNFGLSAHTEGDAAGATQGGTFNLTVPAGQCVGPSHLTSKPTCLKINAESGPPPQGAWYAWLRSTVTEGSGAWSNTVGSEIGSGWRDNGNPDKQLAPDREADSPSSSCPADGTPDPNDPYISHPIVNGNVTIHPAQ
jgi:hypothetical protein